MLKTILLTNIDTIDIDIVLQIELLLR